MISKFFKKPTKKNSGQPEGVLPLKGFEESHNPIAFVDNLSDDELIELNSLLDWKAFVVDTNGRRFGNMAWSGKRSTPQVIPDYRHNILNDRIPLQSLKVLEIGCFEGIHTISLCRLANEVVAVDSRINNVVKTIVRCNLFNQKPTVLKCDVEKWDCNLDYLKSDICHHFGVLYHLVDPVGHLYKLSTLVSKAIFLDTHIALPTNELLTFNIEGKSFRYKRYQEGGKAEVFSGMYDHAKWLLLDDIVLILKSIGFDKVEIIEERNERNGPRVLLLAQR